MERSASVINSLSLTEGEKRRLYLSFDYLFLTVCYLDLLSAECIRNVTRNRMEGEEKGMVARHRGHKRE